jgi:S1-C subfamily serine protease
VTSGSAGAGFGFGIGSQAGSQAYAVPIDTAQSVASQIVAGKGSATVHVGPSAFIGIQVSSGFGGFGSSNSGVTVGGVVSGQPAAKAGLAAGDVITAIDGSSVTSADELSSLMLGHHPGDTISVTWTSSAGQSHTASLELASGPPA